MRSINVTVHLEVDLPEAFALHHGVEVLVDHRFEIECWHTPGKPATRTYPGDPAQTEITKIYDVEQDGEASEKLQEFIRETQYQKIHEEAREKAIEKARDIEERRYG